MSELATLPETFSELEQFVDQWALDTADARHGARLNSSAKERADFFAALGPRAAEILDYLDTRPLDTFTNAEENLMRLMLSLAQVGMAEEIQRDQEAFHAQYARFITINRAVSDHRS
jgi:hypothetical protein